MIYEKIPVRVEAKQYTGENFKELADWSNNFIFTFGDEVRVDTLEGTSYAVPVGYWIIKGVAGEFYPCENKIFNKTYRKVIND